MDTRPKRPSILHAKLCHMVRSGDDSGYPPRSITPEVRGLIRHIKAKAKEARAMGYYWAGPVVK